MTGHVVRGCLALLLGAGGARAQPPGQVPAQSPAQAPAQAPGQVPGQVPAGSTAGALAPPAVAAPFVTPQHDVDVTYVIAGPGIADPAAPGKADATRTQRMRWSASLWRQRLDPPGTTSLITDYRAQTLLVLDRAHHAALLLPAPPSHMQPIGARASGAMQRLGAQTIAGIVCTDWRMQDDSGTDSTVCFTDDGVMLRARQSVLAADADPASQPAEHTLIEASQVLYGPQDPALFEAPPGTTVKSPSSR